jgi:hypothetical protein
VNLIALVGVTLASSALAVAGAGGSLRVILYLLERNQAVAVEQVAPAPVATQPMIQETTSIAA